MNKESESERFRRLADEDLELVYESIKTSDEPWWGLGILSNREFFEVRDTERIKDLIELRSEFIIESLKTVESPWEITWSMWSYYWFFERKDTIKALSEVIRDRDYSWQIMGNLIDYRVLMENENLQSSFVHAIQNSKHPAAVIDALRNYPGFLSEEKTISAIITALNSTENIIPLITEATKIRLLDERDEIQEAIKKRIDDVVSAIQPTKFNWTYITDLRHVSIIMEDERIINQIISTMKQQDSFLQYVAISSIRMIPTLSGNVSVQKTVAEVLEDYDAQEICRLLYPIGESPLLVRSEYVKKAISKRMDSIAKNILEAEAPRAAVENIGMIQAVRSDNHVRDAILKRMPDILQDVRNAVEDPYFTWNFVKLTAFIPEIYHHPEVRELIGTNIIMNDDYGNYTSRIADYPSLAQDASIRKAVLTSINEMEEPAWFICSLTDSPNLYNDAEIGLAIEGRIPRIVELIEADDDVERLASEIADNKFLMNFKEIRNAILSKVGSKPTPWRIIAGLPDEILKLDNVSDIIREGTKDLSEKIWDAYSNSFDWVVIHVLRSDVASGSRDVKNALDNYLDMVLEELENVWEVWYSIGFIEDIPYYVNNDRITAAIKNRVDDIAHVLLKRDDWSSIVNNISYCEDVLTDDRIVASIIKRLTTFYEPYSLLYIENLQPLLEKAEIRNALIERVPDLIFGITSTDEAPFIVEEIEKIDFLRSNPEISKAIEMYKQAIG